MHGPILVATMYILDHRLCTEPRTIVKLPHCK